MLNIGQSIVTEALPVKISVLAHKMDSCGKYHAKTEEHKIPGMKRQLVKLVKIE